MGPFVRRMDNFILRINPYPVEKIGAVLILTGQRANFINWIGIYSLDKVIHSSYNRTHSSTSKVIHIKIAKKLFHTTSKWRFSTGKKLFPSSTNQLLVSRAVFIPSALMDSIVEIISGYGATIVACRLGSR